MTPEQQARDMIVRMGIADSRDITSGDLVELANMIAELAELRAAGNEYRLVMENVSPYRKIASARNKLFRLLAASEGKDGR